MKTSPHNSPAHKARWLTSFLDNVPAAVYRTTVEGRIIYCNRATARLFGCSSAEELQGTSVTALYQDMRARGYLVQGILINLEVRELLLPQIKKDGTPIWCRLGARAVLDDEGVVEFIDEWVRDVTGEIGEAEADATIMQLINAANSFVVFIDLKGRILDMDPTGYRSLNFDKLDVLGLSLTRFVRQGSDTSLDRLLDTVVRTGSGEERITLRDGAGQDRSLLMKAFLKHKGGQQDHIVCIVKDIAKDEKQEDDLASASKLEGVLEMAGGVSHRLNQPLMSINSLVNDLLGSMEKDDARYAKIQRIDEQVKEMNAIARKISGISRYEATDYVWGLKIVDIDKASGNDLEE
ncbi:MAG: PAS domain-containing protein [Desulfohalobiaceae bacterium]